MSKPAIQPIQVRRWAALDPAVTAELQEANQAVGVLRNELVCFLSRLDEITWRLRELERRFCALLPYLWQEEGSLPSDLEEKGPDPL